MYGAMLKTIICEVNRPKNFSKIKWSNFKHSLMDKLDSYTDRMECYGDSIRVMKRQDKGLTLLYDFFHDFCNIMEIPIDIHEDTIEWFGVVDKTSYYTGKEI